MTVHDNRHTGDGTQHPCSHLQGNLKKGESGASYGWQSLQQPHLVGPREPVRASLGCWCLTPKYDCKAESIVLYFETLNDMTDSGTDQKWYNCWIEGYRKPNRRHQSETSRHKCLPTCCGDKGTALTRKECVLDQSHAILIQILEGWFSVWLFIGLTRGD